MDKQLDFTKSLIQEAENADKGYFEYAHIIACRLPNSLHDQLAQLVDGPVHAGLDMNTLDMEWIDERENGNQN